MGRGCRQGVTFQAPRMCAVLMEGARSTRSTSAPRPRSSAPRRRPQPRPRQRARTQTVTLAPASRRSLTAEISQQLGTCAYDEEEEGEGVGGAGIYTFKVLCVNLSM